MRRLKPFAILVVALSIASCGPKLVQERLDPDEDITLNTRWNDVDAHEAAHTMIESCLDTAWLVRFAARNDGARPIVIVTRVKNKTDEHIDVETLTNEIRTELIHSGQVRFVDAKLRDDIIAEYDYMNSGMVRKDQRKGPGQQLGADFLLAGEISSISSELGDQKLVTYHVDLRLTNLATSEIEWAERHKIKKLFERSGYSY